MKSDRTRYLFLVGDGMGDYPLDQLNGKTPLQAANTPHMDFLASRGTMGTARTVPEGKEPGSDIANLNILGYDPALYHTGRAPLEAASIGIHLGKEDVAYRCNLVTLSFGDEGSVVMEDYAGGHIENEQARTVVEELERNLGTEDIRFHQGVSYRHVMVWRNGRDDLPSIPPHDMLGKEVGCFLSEEYLPRVNTLVRESWKIFGSLKEKALPSLVPNSIWLWGEGRAPRLPSFKEKFGLNGGVISAVDLLHGIGIYAGLTPIHVPGATGYLDTNYAGKVEYTLKHLEEQDVVFLHVEAPDEASHSGNLDLKMKAIEQFDSLVVGPILQGLERFDHFRVLLITDHYTPIALRTHIGEPVPFVIYDNRRDGERNPLPRGFNEVEAGRSGVRVDEAFRLVEQLVAGND